MKRYIISPTDLHIADVDKEIEIDKKYAADFIKNKKHVFDLDKDNTISGTYFLSRDKNILYDDVIDGQRKCNVDLSRHLFIEQKDYYDYISTVIKKIIGNEEEDEMTDLYDRALQLSEFKFFINLAKEYRKGIYDSNDRYLPLYRIMPMILKECFDKSDKDPKILVGKCIDKSISLIHLYIITGGRDVEKFAYWLFNDESVFSDCYDNVQEEKLAYINCPNYKVIISAFNKLDIATKKKLYNSICVMAHKFDDDFYDFYINQYRSVENKLSDYEVIIEVGAELPLLIFAGFYKIYTNNVNNRVYFTKMIEDLYSAMLNDINSDINSFIISFMENKDHDKECYLNKNDSHDAEIYFNQLESISVDFADFLKNELFVELKKVDPNIISNIKTSKIFESNTTISSDEIKEASGVYDISYIEKCISDMVKTDMVKTSYSCCDSNCNKYQTPVHSSTEQDNKIQLNIQLSEEEITNIYYDIVGRLYILSPRELSYRRNKINDVLYNLKNTKLKEKLEFILNSNMDILRSFKYSDDNIVKEISKAVYGFAGISDLCIKHIIIYIIRNLYNKYIYNNKLPSIIDICIKYQNKIEDDTICDAIFTYILNLDPVRFFGKIIEDYYNRDEEELDNIEYYTDFMKDCFGVPKWDE